MMELRPNYLAVSGEDELVRLADGTNYMLRIWRAEDAGASIGVAWGADFNEETRSAQEWEALVYFRDHGLFPPELERRLGDPSWVKRVKAARDRAHDGSDLLVPVCEEV